MRVTSFDAVSFAPVSPSERLSFAYVVAQLRNENYLLYSNEGTGLIVVDRWLINHDSSKPKAKTVKNLRFRYAVMSADQETTYIEFRSLSKAISFAKQGA